MTFLQFSSSLRRIKSMAYIHEEIDARQFMNFCWKALLHKPTQWCAETD